MEFLWLIVWVAYCCVTKPRLMIICVEFYKINTEMLIVHFYPVQYVMYVQLNIAKMTHNRRLLAY